MTDNDRATEKKPKRARVRSGCMRCRAKRRKCDEAKPVCGRCKEKKETCQWGTRIVFRERNNRSLDTPQLFSTHKKPKSAAPGNFEIQDVTAEVIRDYQQQEFSGNPLQRSMSTQSTVSPQTVNGGDVPFDAVNAWKMPPPMDMMALVDSNSVRDGGTYHDPTHESIDDVSNGLPAVEDLSYIWPSPTAHGLYDDSIFLPGSAYLDAHSTLRSHLYHEANASAATREGTPEPRFDDKSEAILSGGASSGHTTPRQTAVTEEEEFSLLQNWVEEVAPWLDKFDSHRLFQHTLPIMARSHAHLRYAILATSARQLERKEHSTHTDRSLYLYQKAIQLVLPELHTRSTAVIASCVVLCVLEMQSSSPKAWRQHLDGCAHLIQASGIHGLSGGINQALFWCFARMDVCGGLITSMNTLIPMQSWAPGTMLEDHATLFKVSSDFNAHACYAVYLCGHVLDLLAGLPQLASRVSISARSADRSSSHYTSRWTQLWQYISDWHHNRPDEMLPIHVVETTPFPKILYSNPAAISGNQLHHTASILMLQHKPAGLDLTPHPKSIFWHARRACAISISNHHHGAWTNSIQPLWIAGQWMSHPSEQTAILELLARIEEETGWGTKWRAEDLKAFWGE